MCGKHFGFDGLPGGGEMSSISKKRAPGIRGPDMCSDRALRGAFPVGMCHEPSMKMFLECVLFL